MNVPDGLVNYAPVRIFAPGKWRCTRDGLWAIVDSAGAFVVQCRYNACGKPLITCTTEHPFYVHGKGWVAAQRLVAGDQIELQSGEDAYVNSVEHEKLAVPIQVYNFEVEEFHTYYVGGACVLVHNRCLLGRRLTSIEPDPGSGYHAHHVFPAHLRSKFSQIGINVDEGRFGAWVKAGPHLKFSRAYNQAWKSFFNNGPTREGALALGRQLAQRHGYRIHF